MTEYYSHFMWQKFIFNILQDRPTKMELSDANFFLRKRYYVMISVMMGWMMLIMLRVNLSICLVDMTSNRTYLVDNTTFVKVSTKYTSPSTTSDIITDLLQWADS